MPIYKAPIRDFQFILQELLNVPEQLSELSFYAEQQTNDPALWLTILEESARFIETEVQPLNRVGDEQGCRLVGGQVTTPEGFKKTYQKFCAAGWAALGADPSYGGSGLPTCVLSATREMLNSANVAWAMYAGLTYGAYRALHAVGSERLKNLYLPPLVSGEWTGTMCLTEAHAGTDLGLIRTRATWNSDGTYRISGSKIFISSGEHDLTENIVHLVLARIEGSPEGTAGLSLFLVPKMIPDEQGHLTERNKVTCGSLENKMGIHGNATAVLHFDEAKGELVGEVGKGIAHMFIMMNGARLGTALQGLGLGEVAYQNALSYAKHRVQMRHPAYSASQPAPILHHADVRRMLLTGKAYTEAGRALVAWISLLLDIEKHHPSEEKRESAAGLVALLTPVAKSFMTDNGFETTVLSQQVLGGHGYITELGMEQFVRDARITQIYEGTNGIQALDLLGRKVLLDGGQKWQSLIELLGGFVTEYEHHSVIGGYAAQLGQAISKLQSLTALIAQKPTSDEVGAVARDYLRFFGHVMYGYLWAKMALRAAEQRQSEHDKDGFYLGKIQTAHFYFTKLFPETEALAVTIRAGAQPLLVDNEAVFGWRE